MRIYFIRHAVAVPHDAPGVVDDASRELTREGIARMRRQAKGLLRIKVEPGRVWTSPCKRARQTAEILAEELGVASMVRTLPALAPDGKFERVMQQIAAYAAKCSSSQARRTSPDVALVGHEPGLSEMITRLLTGAGDSVIQLKKGGAACVQLGEAHLESRGELLWLLTPRQLRDLA